MFAEEIIPTAKWWKERFQEYQRNKVSSFIVLSWGTQDVFIWFLLILKVSWKIPKQLQIIHSTTNCNQLSAFYFETYLEFQNQTVVQWLCKSDDIKACTWIEEAFTDPHFMATGSADVIGCSTWIYHHCSLSHASLHSVCGCVWYSKCTLLWSKLHIRHFSFDLKLFVPAVLHHLAQKQEWEWCWIRFSFCDAPWL